MKIAALVALSHRYGLSLPAPSCRKEPNVSSLPLARPCDARTTQGSKMVELTGMLAMSWYVSYRNGSSVVMNVFKCKEIAISAARHLLDVGCDDGLEVGPMLEALEGNILKAEDIRRIDQNE
jgi:hypothetical protein